MSKILKEKDPDGNTILHLLATRPTTTYVVPRKAQGHSVHTTLTGDEKMNMMLGFLFRGAIPNEKNIAGQTFIQANPRIKPKLCNSILESSTTWITVQWNIIESWISLEEDEILKTLFKTLVKFHEVFNLKVIVITLCTR